MGESQGPGGAVQIANVQAWFVGSRIDVRELELGDTLALAPLTVRAGERGYAVLFRYGAVVLVNLSPVEQAAFLKTVALFVSDRFDSPETEQVVLALASDQKDTIDADGTIQLHDLGIERLQIVAHILAKSAVLAHYEERVAQIFDQIEQFAEQLRRGVGRRAAGRDLLPQIGDVLLAQIQTVGRVEITEKPESTWDRLDLDRLYERLSLEYELRDRDRALSRKLEFISNTTQTYLDLLQNRQSMRLEWYIVVLILIEIFLSVYQLIFSS